MDHKPITPYLVPGIVTAFAFRPQEEDMVMKVWVQASCDCAVIMFLHLVMVL